MIKIKYLDGSTKIVNVEREFYAATSTEVNGRVVFLTAADKAEQLARDHATSNVVSITIWNGDRQIFYRNYKKVEEIEVSLSKDERIKMRQIAKDVKREWKKLQKAA